MMDLRDLEVIKELLEKYETGSKLTKKEEILKEKIDTLLAFEEVNTEYNNKKREFQKHMEELIKKAGE